MGTPILCDKEFGEIFDDVLLSCEAADCSAAISPVVAQKKYIHTVTVRHSVGACSPASEHGRLERFLQCRKLIATLFN